MRVLIADDEALIRMGLKRMLEEMGHQVVGVAADGARAVELARQTRPDLAILDIKMPGIDGLEAARAITAEHPMPILILTAYSDRELVERAKQVAVLAYLVKPIKDPELAAAIEIAVARFEEWQELEGEAKSLQGALATRQVVEQAKHVLRGRYGLTEQEAFMRIHQQSRDSRRPMREVAEEILREE